MEQKKNVDLYKFSSNMVFKIVSKDELSAILKTASYAAESLKTDGFIHLSEKDQIPWVLKSFYSDVKNYFVIALDKTRFISKLQYDTAEVDDSDIPEKMSFPHLYGPLNTDAIVAILKAQDFLSSVVPEKIETLIKQYKFKKLENEGCFYRETYRSDVICQSGKNCGTAMIGMYTAEPLSFSCFHRLSHDETWHFYGGDSLRLVLLFPDGSSKDVVLGSDYTQNQKLQYTIKAGTWQAGEVVSGGVYSLFGCTVTPGFSLDVFEAADPDTLKKQYKDRLFDILRFSL